MLKITQIKLGKYIETSFKAPFANHNQDFNHKQYKKAQNFQNIYGR